MASRRSTNARLAHFRRPRRRAKPGDIHRTRFLPTSEVPSGGQIGSTEDDISLIWLDELGEHGERGLMTRISFSRSSTGR